MSVRMKVPEGPMDGAHDGSGNGVIKTTIQRADAVQRASAPLGFMVAVIKRFGEDRSGQLAALISYYGFFSLFPLMLVLVTLSGILFTDSASQERLLDAALRQFPVIGDELRKNVGSLPGKGIGLAVGLLGAVWGGLGGIKAAQNAMDSVWDVPIRRQPSFPTALLRAGLMLVTLGLFILLASFLGGVAAGTSDVSGWIRVAGIAGSLLLNLAVFLVAFRVLTVEDVSWGDVFPGALVGAVGWLILQTLGGYLIGHKMTSAQETYGLFAAVIALLTWIYLGAQLTLFAAEVNVVRARRLWPRALDPSSMTAADERALRDHAKVEERRDDQEVDVEFQNTTTASEDPGSHPGSETDVGAQRIPRNKRRLPELLHSIGTDVQLLARQQAELAKLELGKIAGTKARGIGAFAATAILCLFVVGFLGLAGAAALDLIMPLWASLLIVGAVFLLLAAVAAVLGRRSLRAEMSPEATKQTVKEDVAWAKRQLKR